MSKELTESQQEQLKKFQELNQNRQALQQNKLQADAAIKEIEKTLTTLKDMEEENEVYQISGHILFKTQASSAREKLNSDLEIREFQSKKVGEQLEDLTKKLTVIEKTLRSELGN